VPPFLDIQTLISAEYPNWMTQSAANMLKSGIFMISSPHASGVEPTGNSIFRHALWEKRMSEALVTCLAEMG
jgi:hypothetical protein